MGGGIVVNIVSNRVSPKLV